LYKNQTGKFCFRKFQNGSKYTFIFSAMTSL
jgi:hypothetical protein